MYSVEDLLVSHGYKPRGPVRNFQGRPRVRTLLNSLEHDPAEPGRRSGSTCESSPNPYREPRPRQGSPGQPVLVWAWEQGPGQDQPYWRSRRPHQGAEDTGPWRMARSQSPPSALREDPWSREDMPWTAKWTEAPRPEGTLDSWSGELAVPCRTQSRPLTRAVTPEGSSDLDVTLLPQDMGLRAPLLTPPGQSIPQRPRFGKPLRSPGNTSPQPDLGLEPPLYVPPPSYRCPQPIRNPYLEEPPGQVATSSPPRPHSPLGSPAAKPAVLYIPFHDPRVRHFQLDKSLPDAPCWPPPELPPHMGSAPAQALQPPQGAEDAGPADLQSPRVQRLGEAQPQLRAFEAGVQGGRSAGRKAQETIFCLVSVPMKPEPRPARTDGDGRLQLTSEGPDGLDWVGRPEPPGQSRHEPTGPAASKAWPRQLCQDQQKQTGPGKPLRAPRALAEAELTTQPLVPVSPELQRPRPGAHHLRSQLSLGLSSSSAFSRMTSAPGPPAWPTGDPSPPRRSNHGPSSCPQAEVVKGQPTGPCNSQQLFGQFLLKPVSRRPWDIIGQLESLNRELQGEVGSSQSGPEDSDAEGSGQTPAAELDMVRVDAESRADRVDAELVVSYGDVGQVAPPEQPASPKWQRAGWRDPPLVLGSLCPAQTRWAEDRASQSLAIPRSVKASLAPGQRDTLPSTLSSSTEQEKPQVRNSTPTTDPRLENGLDTLGLLSLVNKTQGLSTPDLSSVGLTSGLEQSEGDSGVPGGTVGSPGVPLNESLQARAARILGIEVAMDALLPNGQRAGPSPHPQDPPAPQEPSQRPGPPSQPHGPTDASYSRRRCGWTQSPLFVGDRDTARQGTLMPESPRVDVDTPELRPRSPQVPDASNKSSASDQPSASGQPSTSGQLPTVDTQPTCRSTLFHVLAPGPHMAPSRLLRMREVSLASRQRRLSSSNSDSTDEEHPGGPTSTLGCSITASRSAPPPAENGYPAALRERGMEFWCPESYDPSRVERV